MMKTDDAAYCSFRTFSQTRRNKRFPACSKFGWRTTELAAFAIPAGQ